MRPALLDLMELAVEFVSGLLNREIIMEVIVSMIGFLLLVGGVIMFVRCNKKEITPAPAPSPAPALSPKKRIAAKKGEDVPEVEKAPVKPRARKK